MSYPHSIVTWSDDMNLSMLNQKISRLKDGERLLIEGLPEPIYRQAHGFSSSELKHAEVSPAHWLADKNKKKEFNPTFNLGTAVHMAILEPERMENDLVLEPERNLRSNDGKQAYIDWMLHELDIRGRDDIKVKFEHYKVENPKANLSAQYKELQSLLPFTFINEAEQAICKQVQKKVDKFYEQHELSWSHTEISGWIRIGDHFLKGRADALDTENRWIYDIKTTRSINEHSFVYDADKLKYNRSAFNYMLIFDCFLFRWIAVEKEFPYAIGPFQASKSDDWVLESSSILYQTLDKLQDCINVNKFSEPYDAFVQIEPNRFKYKSKQPQNMMEELVNPFE